MGGGSCLGNLHGSGGQRSLKIQVGGKGGQKMLPSIGGGGGFFLE